MSLRDRKWGDAFEERLAQWDAQWHEECAARRVKEKARVREVTEAISGQTEAMSAAEARMKLADSEHWDVERILQMEAEKSIERGDHQRAHTIMRKLEQHLATKRAMKRGGTGLTEP